MAVETLAPESAVGTAPGCPVMAVEEDWEEVPRAEAMAMAKVVAMVHRP